MICSGNKHQRFVSPVCGYLFLSRFSSDFSRLFRKTEFSISESCQLCRLQPPVYFTHRTSATKAVMQAHRLSAPLQSACFSTYVEVVHKQFRFHHHLLVGSFAEEGCQLLHANCCWERVPIATRHRNFVKSIVVCKEKHKHQQPHHRGNSPHVKSLSHCWRGFTTHERLCRLPLWYPKFGYRKLCRLKCVVIC